MYVPGKVVLPDIMIYVRKRKVPRWSKFQFQFVYSQPIRIEAVREQDPI